MGAEVAFQRPKRHLRKFLTRVARLAVSFVVEPLESLEHANRAIGGVAGLDGEACALAVGLEFLIFGIASFKHFNGQGQHLTQWDTVHGTFLLGSVSTMVVDRK